MCYRRTWVSRILLGIPFALLALPVLIARPLDPGAWGYAAVVVAVYGVLWFLIGRARIEVTDEGISQHGLLGTRPLRWDEVGTYWYSANPRGDTALTGLAGAVGAGVAEGVTSTAEKHWGKAVRIAYHLRLRAADGRELCITSGFARADEAIAAALRRVQPRLVEAARSRLARGERVEAGPLALTREHLTWKDKAPLPIPDIEQVEIFGGGGKTLLRVLQKGKAWRHASIDARRLPLVPLLLELLRDFGVTVHVPDWFVP